MGVPILNRALGPPKWRYDTPSTATDITDRLDKLRGPRGFDIAAVTAALQKTRPAPAELRILLVPGLLGNLLAPLRAVGISTYLDAQASALEGVKARVERTRINTQASAAENARAIRAMAARIEGPVCLISHSKGGVDVLECLLEHPSLWRKIACWISIQAPFAGSPIAQAAADSPAIEPLSRALLALTGGSRAALADLSSEPRAAYLAERRRRVQSLARRVRILSVAASTGSKYVFRPLRPTWAWMDASGIKNDALVPLTSAILPHARYVLLEDVDHLGAVSGGSTSLPESERRLLTLALLALALQA